MSIHIYIYVHMCMCIYIYIYVNDMHIHSVHSFVFANTKERTSIRAEQKQTHVHTIVVFATT